VINFWQNLKKPITALAPMEEVTDTVFRQIVMSCGSPSVFFTEFTSCEGVQSVGQARVIHRLKYSEIERPIVAQVWGITPEDYRKTAKLVLELGFDGIDINMGCPVKKVIKQGACSALIKNPNLAKEIIMAVKEGSEGNIPVSVKTRIGFSKIETREWCGFLLQECDLEALTIHGRTVKEESGVPCHWDEIAKVVEIRNELGSSTVILGNGDVQSLGGIEEKVSQYGVDGVMVGRGIFKNPWLFNTDVSTNSEGFQYFVSAGVEIDKKLKIQTLLKHLYLWRETWKEEKPFPPLKKFFKIYLHQFPGAGELRAKLMELQKIEETIEFLESLLT